MIMKQTWGQGHILVVDDDLLIRSLFSRWLLDEGYDCETAVDAQDALEHLSKTHFDLVTLDIRMPGLSGLELLQRIKEQFPDTAVLMLTGEGEQKAAIQALKNGAFGYLHKPVKQSDILNEVRGALVHQRSIIRDREHTQYLADKIREQSSTILAVHEETVQSLVRASLYRDEETGSHIRRVGEFSGLLALQMGRDQDHAARIRQAAPLHDLGKIAIPDAILRKPGPLTSEEMAIMRTHTIVGASMLSEARFPMLKMAQDIALNHHERWDGRGYPNRIGGNDIPEAARIVAIADVYDALSHDRVYRPALPESEVLAILRDGRGRHFDSEILDAFFEILPQIRYVNESILEDYHLVHPAPIECA